METTPKEQFTAVLKTALLNFREQTGMRVTGIDVKWEVYRIRTVESVDIQDIKIEAR